MPPAALVKPASARPALTHPAALARLLLSFNLTRFLAVGCAGLTLDAATFFVLTHEGAPEPLARALSLAAATLLTWRLNRRFTFGESARHEAFEGGWYTGVALGAQGLNYLAFLSLRAALPEIPALGALLAGAMFAALFSYTGQRFLTFRGRVRR